MTIFDTSSDTQEGGSNVPVTRDPVHDSSQAIQAVGNLAKGALDFVAKSNELEGIKTEGAAIQKLAGQFAKLDAAVGATGKARITPNSARSQKNQLILAARQAGVSSKALKDLMGINSGKEEDYRAPETIAEDSAIEEAQGSGHIQTYMSREEQLEAAGNFRQERELLKELDLRQKKLTYKSGQQNYDEKAEQIENRKSLANYATIIGTKKRSALKQITTDLRNGTISMADANVKVDQLKDEMTSQVAEIAQNADPAYVSGISKAIFAQFDIAKKVINGEYDQAAADRYSQNAIAFQKSAALGDPKIQQLAALEKLFPTISLMVMRNDQSIKFMKENGNYKGRVVDIFVSTDEEAADPGLTQETRDYLDDLKTFVKTLDANQATMTPQDVSDSKEGIANQFNAILKSAGNNNTPAPQAAKDFISFVASKEYLAGAKLAGNDLIDPEHRQAASDALDFNGKQVVSHIARSIEQATAGNFLGAVISGGVWATPISAIVDKDIKVGDNGVAIGLKLKEGLDISDRDRQQLSMLLRKKEVDLTKIMGDYIKGAAHLEGHDNYKKVFNDNYSAMFGEEKAK